MLEVNVSNAVGGSGCAHAGGCTTCKTAARLMGAVLLVTSLLACSSVPDDPTTNWSPNRIYQEAKEEADSARYDQAIVLYEKLEGRAAGTPLAQQAQLEKAYTYHLNGEKAKAQVTIDRFLKLHPASPAYDYALYLKGTLSFTADLGLLGRFGDQRLSDRDQLAAKEAFQTYRELVTRFPDSKYSVDARQRMIYIVNSLAEYEVHVARYYFSRGAYLAAINRAQQSILDYENAPALEQAMELIVASYDALGLASLRDDAKRVLEKSFPNRAATSEKNEIKPWWKFW